MTVKLDQALIAAFRDGAFGLPVIYDNEDASDSAQPEPGVEHFELTTFSNSVEPLTLAHSGDTTGVLQFTLAWPSGGGAMPAKLKVQEVFDAFPAGRRVSHGGQTLVIQGHHLFKASQNNEKGRFEVVGRINYAAIVPR